MKKQHIAGIMAVVMLTAGGITHANGEKAASNKPADLLDASLSHWEIFTGVPHKTVAGLPDGTPTSEDGMKGTPLGLNNDPKKVFSVITEDGNLVLKVSGEIYAGLTTKQNHSIHVVNGQVVLSVADARNKQGEPLTSGQIQIQSEAAECSYRKIRISPIVKFPEDLAAKAGLAVTGGIAPGEKIQ